MDDFTNIGIEASRREDNLMMEVNNDISTIKAGDGSDTVTFMVESPSKLLLVLPPPASSSTGPRIR
ncbi:unnamed protein product [Camellia sinensis]